MLFAFDLDMVYATSTAMFLPFRYDIESAS